MLRAALVIVICLSCSACHSRRAKGPQLEQVTLCDIEVPYSQPPPAVIRAAEGDGTWLEGPAVPSADQRARSLGVAFDRYSPTDQLRLKTGAVRVGLDEAALFVA